MNVFSLACFAALTVSGATNEVLRSPADLDFRLVHERRFQLDGVLPLAEDAFWPGAQYVAHVTALPAAVKFVTVDGAERLRCDLSVEDDQLPAPPFDVAVLVTLDVGKPLGVFGSLASLTLNVALRDCRVFACDLAGGPTQEITAWTKVEGDRLINDDETLARVGSMAAPSDPSAPGALVWIAQL